MEVKVFVNGLPRVVCGLTKDTTCQEVVIALAQALGQPGRYLLQEKFKDFERCMSPNERVLETLERYGEQARDVQLTLILNGPAGWDLANHAKMSRYQPFPPLRRKDAGSRLRRGSSSLSLHRQSLPPLTEQQVEDVKRPKRKSLTIMEEAWEWLENLGKGKVYSTASEKDISKKSEKKNRTSLEVTLSLCKNGTGRNSKAKSKNEIVVKSDGDSQTSCRLRSKSKGRECKYSEAKRNDLVMDEEKKRLFETILNQRSCLEDLYLKMAQVDRQIFDLEQRQKVRKVDEEAKLRVGEEEWEQIMFWENELIAEERHEKDLQSQFLEMKGNVLQCKAKLEEYRIKIQHYGDSQGNSESNSAKDLIRGGHVTPNRKFQPREDGSPPHALVAPCQIKDRRPTGPTELREWWTRWSQAQKTTTKNKVIHRSELTIYLKSTKV